jgi:hypothetical protein
MMFASAETTVPEPEPGNSTDELMLTECDCLLGIPSRKYGRQRNGIQLPFLLRPN